MYIRKDWQDRGALPMQPQSRPTAQVAKNGRGGILSSLISEGGAAGGAALGTAIAPGLGTIIGGILGGFGGRLAENKVRDDRFDLNSVSQAAGEGLLSGTLAGAGNAFRAIKGGVGALRGGGAIDDAIKAAGQGFSSAPTSMIAGRLAGASDDMAVRSFRFTPSQLSSIKKTTGVDASKILKKEKLVGKSADDVEQLVNTLNEQYGAILDTIPAVNRTLLKKNLQKAYNPLLKSPNLSLQRVGQQIQTQADEILRQYKGRDVPGRELNALKRTFDANTNFDARIANPELAKLSEKVGTALRRTVNESSKDQSLRGLGLRIRDLTKIKDAALTQSNLGRGSQALNLTDLIAGGAGGGAFGLPGAAVAMGAKRAVNSPTAQRAGASLLGGAANLANSGAGQLATRVNSAVIPQLAGRVPGALSGASQPQESSLDANQMMNMASPTNFNTSIDQFNTTQPQQSQPNDLASALSDPSVQQQLLLADLLDPNSQGSNISALQAIFDISAQGQGGMSDLSQSSKNALASSDNAINTVDQLEQLFTAAGSGSGRIGGTIKEFASDIGLDENAKVYNSLANASVTQIAKALAGSGAGTVSDIDAKVIMDALPTLKDTPYEAAAKFAALKQRLQNARDNTLLYGSGYEEPNLAGALVGAQSAYPY